MKTQATDAHTESVGIQPRVTFHTESHKNYQGFSCLRLAVVCAMAITLAGALSAQPITFTFSGTGTGTLSTASFTYSFTNAEFTLTLSTDETLIQNSNHAFFTPPVAGAGIQLTDFNFGTFTDNWQILNDQLNQLIEFTDSIHGTVLGGTNPAFASYNLQSALGPVCVTGPTTFGLFNSIPTSIGSVTLSSVSNVCFTAIVGGGTWSQIPSPPTNYSGHNDTCLLLTDGTVACQQYQTSAWFRLAPGAFGNYVTGAWSQMPSMPACILGDCPDDNSSPTPPYAPTAYASAVLADGTLYVVGGEDNNNVLFTQVNMGAYYNPVMNTWTALPAPFPAGQVGDVQSVVLDDGTFMMAKHGFATAFLPPGCRMTACFTPATTMQGKTDANNEEGWTLLPGGNVLVVNAEFSPGSQIYTPGTNPSVTGIWTYAGNPGNVVDVVHTEIGPQVLRPDGTVIVFGGNGNNAVYDTNTGTWAGAPPFPIINGQQLDVADGPAALLPNGNVLVGASPGSDNSGTYFYEWNGTTLKPGTGAAHRACQNNYRSSHARPSDRSNPANRRKLLLGLHGIAFYDL